MSDKVVVISLDGMTLDVIEPLIKMGRMPNFEKLAHEGVMGKLRSTIPPVTLPVFPTFTTGVNSGVHGVFDLRRREENSYKSVPVTIMESPVPKLWQIISSHGKRVCVGNVPGSYPPDEVSGCMISGKLTPTYESEFTWPKGLKTELEEKGIPHKFFAGAKYTDRNKETFLQNAHELVKRYRDIALYLIKEKEWDYFQFAFNAPDGVQHWYWKHMDENHPAHDPNVPERYRDAIFSVYERLDEAVGSIVREARNKYKGEQVNVILFSDHGFGPLLGNINMNKYLLDRGFLKLRSSPLTWLKGLALRLGWNGRNVVRVLDFLGLTKKKIAVPKRERDRKLLHWAEDLLKSTFIGMQDVDWSRTAAYSSGHWGQIFLNVEGREPQGIVKKGEEYTDLRSQVIEALCELKDPTGDELITETYTWEEIYSGDRMESAPDIVFFAQGGKYVTHGQFNFAVKDVISEPLAGKSGSHRRIGFYMMSGPAVKNVASPPILDILDLSPTVLYLLGLPVPQHMEGKIPFGLLSKSSVVEFEDIPFGEYSHGSIASEDRELIEERLRGLGYLS